MVTPVVHTRRTHDGEPVVVVDLRSGESVEQEEILAAQSLAMLRLINHHLQGQRWLLLRRAPASRRR
jgi:hypothetical protein